MKILITGGTGFIGSHLIPRLLKSDHKIILLKRSSSDTWRIKDFINKIIIYNIDKLRRFDEIFTENRIGLIIHLSGMYVKYHENNKQIKQMNKVNIIIPSVLLDTAARFGVKGFINTGTFFEYKQTNKKMTENSPIKPFNYYTATKLAFEQILKYYASQNKIRAVSLKLFSPYGEKDNKKIIPFIVESFVNEKTLSLSKGEQKLSFTYVKDIVSGYIKTIKFITSSQYKQYENFNIGANKAYTIKQIIGFIRKITGKKNHIKLGTLPYHEKEMMFGICDNGKAEKLLKWSPKTDIITGLTRTYQYYLNHSV